MRQLVIFVFLSISIFIKAQTSGTALLSKATIDTTQIKPLAIGDKCPDFTLSNVINWPTKSVRLSDFRGKWVILDFWAKFCQPCIAMFPKTEALQHQFKDKVQFMPITKDKEEDVRALFARLNKGTGVNYTTATGSDDGRYDKLVQDLFPRRFIPHYVWIDPEGIVRAITDYDRITAENIRSFINGKNPNLPVKNENFMEAYELDPTENMLVKGGARNEASRNKNHYYSVITEYFPNNFPTTFISPEYVSTCNASIKSLYAMAFRYRVSSGYGSHYPMANIILEVDNPDLFDWPDNMLQSDLKEWQRQNTYSYSLCLPKNRYGYQFQSEDLMDWYLEMQTQGYLVKLKKSCEIMLEDLNRYFSVVPSIEKRKRECYVLSCSDTTLIEAKGEDKLELAGDKVSYLKVANGPIHFFLAPFREWFLNSFPIVDETGFKGNIDIEISNVDFGDISSINSALEKYGLRFDKRMREVEVLVLRERKDNN